MVTVSELAVYPVKSFAQFNVERWSVDSFGLAGDRRWMVVDSATGTFITARTQAKMVLVSCRPVGSSLVCHAPGMEELVVQEPSTGLSRQATVWDDTCAAIDAGDRAADWCSRYLNVDCRLVYMPDSSFRQVDTKYAEAGVRTGFADGFPLLLISEASLDLLNSKLDDAVPMKRFRPNIVVTGCAPHEEDDWKRIRIGEVEFSLVKSCTRCVLTTVDTSTGEKGKEPLRTLARYRRAEKGIIFGQNMVHHGQGELAVGMPVEVLG